MARIDLGVATSVFATFLGSDPITVGATPEQKKIWLATIAEEGVLFAYGATEPDAGSDLGALQDHRRARRWKTARSSATRSTAASSGSATAASPMCTRSWRTRRPVRAGSSSRRARRALSTTSLKTSTASASATRRRCRSTTCTSMPTGWSAAWKARGCSRRRRYSATRA